MPFHSYQFILGFLPLCYIAYLLGYKIGGWSGAFKVLALASLAFYANFGVAPLALLVMSVCINFVIGQALLSSQEKPRRADTLLILGILSNLAALLYFKYSNFMIDVAGQVSGREFSHVDLILPIGISFYSFIQIGYLIEARNGQVGRHSFSQYLLFATFLPCITAGPLVMQQEMFSQMRERSDSAFDTRRFAVGLTMFAIGLFKKVVLADSVAPIANTVFDGVHTGMDVNQLTAWAGALCYTLQLYFDFSGYSDMALGLGVIFGLRLPLNFNSPLKATNISDFWRRWHMTMTRFFTAFIYTPLAMRGMHRSMHNRSGPLARFVSTAAVPAIVTFLVAGIWHGDGWTFVVYGLIHGIAIATYLGWRELGMPKLPTPLAWSVTMSVVVSGLVVFRAPDLAVAKTLLGNMWMPSLMPPLQVAALVQVDLKSAAAFIIVLGAIVLLLPNSQQILHRDWVSSDTKPPEVEQEAGIVIWRPAVSSSLVLASLACTALASIGATSTFLYYQF